MPKSKRTLILDMRSHAQAGDWTEEMYKNRNLRSKNVEKSLAEQ